MDVVAGIDEPELLRFARLAAPMLRRLATAGLGTMPMGDRPGAGLEFLDVRAYQPGDDPRHIDWRRTMRHGTTYVRRFRDESSADWAICVDCSPSVAQVAGKWPAAARLASALAYLFLYAGHRVSLVLFAESVRAFCRMGRGPQHFAEIARTLLGADPAEGRRQPGSSRPDASNLGLCASLIAGHCNTFVISDFLVADGMRGALRRLRAGASTVHALQISDAADAGGVEKGTADLEDVETGETAHVEVLDESIAAVNRRLAEFRAALERDCHRMGITFASCDSGDRWDDVLLRYFAGGR